MQRPSQRYNNMDVHFFINGKKVNLGSEPAKNKKLNKFTREKAEKFSKLPKKEPESNVRRLSGRLIYELEMPGVKDLNDISIDRLENSVEVKAISKESAYSKVLSVNLPIASYNLSNGNLIIEFQVRWMS